MAAVMLILALGLLKPNQPQIRFTNFFIGDVKPINLIRIVNVFNINIRIVESQLQNCFIKNFLGDVKYLSFDKNYEQISVIILNCFHSKDKLDIWQLFYLFKTIKKDHSK